MHAFSTSSMSDQLPPGWWQLTRIGSLGVVILLHMVAIHALLRGLSQPAAPPVRAEVFATFIVPEKIAAEPRKPASTSSAAEPVVHTDAMQPVMQPVVNNEPAPRAISAPIPAASTENVAAAMPAPVTPPAAPGTALPPRTLLSGIEYIQEPQPDYQALAKRLGETGEVTLRVLVNEKGGAEQVEVHKTSGSARLDEAARQAMTRAIFKPHMEDGKAVAVYAIAVITFSLNR